MTVGHRPPTRRTVGVRSPLPWLGGLLALYLLVPLVALVSQLASSHGAGFDAPGLGSALAVSLLTATITTAICALLGIPLAYTLAQRQGRLTNLVGAAVLVPLALPPLMSGILLVSVVGPDTALGHVFGGRLTDTVTGIVLAQTFVSAPFTIVAARSAFAAVDPALLDVSATLGLGSWRQFAQVSLPIAARGVGAGLALTWLRAFGEFGATVILAYHPYSLPVFTYVRFGGFGLSEATAPTTLAVLAARSMLLVTRLWPSRKRPAPRRPPPPAEPKRDQAVPVAFDLDQRLGDFHLRVAHRASSPHLAILGASGAGKTSVLRCLAGLAGPRAGAVRFGGRLLSDVPTEDRRLGYVPQEPTLLPHLNVWQQVCFGRGADPRLATYWIEHLRLGAFTGRLPHELSGGQRQRVALARALCRSPELVLLDEPFAALDAPVRHQLRRELRAVQQGGGFASVLVTHDPEEAALLADEVIVIDDGRVLQSRPRAEVFAHPATPVVARLLGIVNISTGDITAPGIIEAHGLSLASPQAWHLPPGTPVLWCIRPEHLQVSASDPGRCAAGFDAIVLDAVDLGSVTEIRLGVAGLELLARAPISGVLAAGAPCVVEIPTEHVTVWAAVDAAPVAWTTPVMSVK